MFLSLRLLVAILWAIERAFLHKQSHTWERWGERHTERHRVPGSVSYMSQQIGSFLSQ